MFRKNKTSEASLGGGARQVVKHRSEMTPGETYINERGVLLDTFKAYGGEFGDARDFATIAARLNRDPAKVGRDPNWAPVEEILWFPLYGPQHDLILLACSAVAEIQGGEFCRANR